MSLIQTCLEIDNSIKNDQKRLESSQRAVWLQMIQMLKYATEKKRNLNNKNLTLLSFMAAEKDYFRVVSSTE